MKGLQKLIVAGVAALGLTACNGYYACDERYDEINEFVVAERTFTCSPARLIYQQYPAGSGNYRMECYDENEGLVFKANLYDGCSSIFCFEKDKCVTLYSKETLPE